MNRSTTAAGHGLDSDLAIITQDPSRNWSFFLFFNKTAKCDSSNLRLSTVKLLRSSQRRIGWVIVTKIKNIRTRLYTIARCRAIYSYQLPLSPIQCPARVHPVPRMLWHPSWTRFVLQAIVYPSQAFSPPSDISRALTGVLCPSRHFLPLRDISCPSQALFASHRHFSPLTGISRPSQAFFDLHRHFSPTTGIYRPLQHFRPSQTLLCHPGNLSKTKPQCQYCIGWDAWSCPRDTKAFIWL